MCCATTCVQAAPASLPHNWPVPPAARPPRSILATQCDWPEALHVLLASGLDPNATTRNGDTALHWAAFNGDYDLAEALLGAGANVNAVGDVGNTPLHVAAAAGHPKVRACAMCRPCLAVHEHVSCARLCRSAVPWAGHSNVCLTK